jgi:hypothetical protein
MGLDSWDALIRLGYTGDFEAGITLAPNPYEGGYAAARPCNGKELPKFPSGLHSHIGSCSLEGPRLSRDRRPLGAAC